MTSTRTITVRDEFQQLVGHVHLNGKLVTVERFGQGFAELVKGGYRVQGELTFSKAFPTEEDALEAYKTRAAELRGVA